MSVSAPGPPPAGPRWLPWAIGAAAALLFLPAVGGGFTAWDDDLYVVRNPAIRDLSPAGIARIFTTPAICNYHPLTILTYALEHAAVGLEPWLYHLTNVVLHAVASVLAYHLARRWLGATRPALLAAALFAAHPLRVESVAWIAERKDVLCGALYLATLLTASRALEHDLGGRAGPARRSYAASLACFLLALLAKALAVSVPAVLLAMLVAARAATRRRWLLVVPFAVLAAAFAIIGVAAHRADGAVHGLHGGSWWTHALTVVKGIGFYAGKMALPVVLSPRYVIEPAASPLEPLVLLGLAVAALLAAAALASLRGDRRVFLGISLCVAAWAPVSGVVPLSTVAADRYLYLPGLGLFLALATALERLTASPSGWRRTAGRSALAAAAVLVAAAAVLTPWRTALWRDPVALWTDALRENPGNPFAFNQLAVAHLAAGRYGEAAANALESARRGLRQPEHLFNVALAYEGLGDAGRELAAAHDIAAAAPGFLPAALVIARRRLESGDLAGCEAALESLGARHGEDPGLLVLHGDLAAARGDGQSAALAYARAIELEPGLAEAFVALGRLLARGGDGPRAVQCLERAVALRGGVPPRRIRAGLAALASEIETGCGAEWGRRARDASASARLP